MKQILLILQLVFLFSCGSDEFEEQSKLSGLRILAITADTPEINSASTVTLTPLISYVTAANTTLDLSWEACPDPGIDFGADLSCDNTAASLRLSGTSSFNTSSLAGSFFTGNASTISVAIPPAAFTLLGSLNSQIQFNGLDYIVLLTYSDQNTDNRVTALKKIKLSTKGNSDLNVNPSFGTIQVAGSSLSSYPSSKTPIDINSASTPESYSVQTTDGLKSFTENMFISWHANSGEFLFNRTDIGEGNEYEPSGSSGVFVAILRDGRGGVATEIISF